MRNEFTFQLAQTDYMHQLEFTQEGEERRRKVVNEEKDRELRRRYHGKKQKWGKKPI